MTALALPTLDLYDAWADCVADFGDEPIPGSGIWQLTDGVLEPTRASCAAMVEIARRESDVRRELPVERVHCDQYWLVDASDPVEVVGFIALRHRLTDHLLEAGGHIGYSVRPARRREGHAGRALGLVLGRAAAIGLTRVLITCDVDNAASYRTIESHGGVLEDVRGGKRRYWIGLE
ncbi:MAG: GNAT family N-acetyltransferase [Nocardioidaceae bacterium]|nr:GNAT family N-acetyltransferase [Nocardioidaceae bacterium]